MATTSQLRQLWLDASILLLGEVDDDIDNWDFQAIEFLVKHMEDLKRQIDASIVDRPVWKTFLRSSMFSRSCYLLVILTRLVMIALVHVVALAHSAIVAHWHVHGLHLHIALLYIGTCTVYT